MFGGRGGNVYIEEDDVGFKIRVLNPRWRATVGGAVGILLS